MITPLLWDNCSITFTLAAKVVPLKLLPVTDSYVVGASLTRSLAIYFCFTTFKLKINNCVK